MLLNQQLAILFSGFIFIWLVILSLFLFKAVNHYRRLTAGVTEASLTKVLEKILKEQGLTAKKIEELVKRAEKIENDGESHIQKIGLVRFNPFSETGGDQSFTLAVLNGVNAGIVISSLHSRQSTRIYAKPIKPGKVEGTQFSKEEIEAISKACKQ